MQLKITWIEFLLVFIGGLIVYKEKMKGVAHNPAVAEGQNKVRLKTIKGEYAENPRKKARTDSKNERRRNVADDIKSD